MSTGSQGPQQLNFRRVQTRVHRQRDEFIAAIHDDDVRRLASSHDHCDFFKPPIHGNYNICYFVHFPNAGSNDVDKWVVRVPLAPCLAEGSRSKLEREVASMLQRHSILIYQTNTDSGRVVKDQTTIPVPKIYAYSLGDGSQLLSSLIIIEYIEGQVFSQARLKTLSDEQRKPRLKYPSIGSLVHGSEGFIARKRIATININMQELEGLQPSKIQSSFYKDRDSLTSANDYVAMLLELADNAFAAGRNSVPTRDEGEDALYHLHIFREYAESWIDCRIDQGPFVLVHGDFEPFNLIVDDNMDIVSVLDWVWSRVVPVQFFKPPLWFKNPDTTYLAYNFVYQDYIKSFNQFLEIVRTRERKKYGNELLADEWAKAKLDSGFLVANALENWTDMDWFAHRYIEWKCYKGKSELRERVKAFMLQNPARKAFIEQKLRDYRIEADSLEDTTDASASYYTEEPALANASMKYSFLRHLWKNTICVSPIIVQLVLGGAIIITGASYLFVKRIQILFR